MTIVVSAKEEPDSSDLGYLRSKDTEALKRQERGHFPTCISKPASLREFAWPHALLLQMGKLRHGKADRKRGSRCRRGGLGGLEKEKGTDQIVE